MPKIRPILRFACAFSGLGGGSCFGPVRTHGDLPAATTDILEADEPFLRGENREVLAHIGSGARPELVSTLPDNNVAGNHQFAIVTLDAQALGLAVTPISA